MKTRIAALLIGLLALAGSAQAQTFSDTYANVLREAGGARLRLSTIATGELLYRNGSTIDGLPQTTFAALAGRAGGQSWTCGTGSGDDCTITPTSHATPGNVDMVFQSAGTNDILEGLRLYRRTTGTASAGIGVSLPFYVENGAGTDRVAAIWRASLTTVTDTSEAGTMRLALMVGGSVPAAGSEQYIFGADGRFDIRGAGGTDPQIRFNASDSSRIIADGAGRYDIVMGGNIMLQLTSTTGIWVGQYASTTMTLTDAATVAINWSDGNVQRVVLGDNRTFTFSNPLEGAIYTIAVCQDATGSRTVTWPTIRWQGGGAPTLTTTANKCDLITCNRINSEYLCSASLNY